MFSVLCIEIQPISHLLHYQVWVVVDKPLLLLIACPVAYVYLLFFQRLKRCVPVGAKDEVKPYAEGFGQLRPALVIILSM